MKIFMILSIAALLLTGDSVPPTFATRWLALPTAIDLETFQAARAAANRPSFCPYAWYGACRIS
jgi:hypothetical protein